MSASQTRGRYMQFQAARPVRRGHGLLKTKQQENKDYKDIYGMV